MPLSQTGVVEWPDKEVTFLFCSPLAQLFFLSVMLCCDSPAGVCNREWLFISLLDTDEERSREDCSFNGLFVLVHVLLNDCDLLTADDTARANGEGLELEYGCGRTKVRKVF